MKNELNEIDPDAICELCETDTEVETVLLVSELNEEGIETLTRTYHKNAYDGIFTPGGHGWAKLFVHKKDRVRARQIVADLLRIRRQAQREADEESSEEDAW